MTDTEHTFGPSATFDAIRKAMRQVEEHTRTLVVHPDYEDMAREAVKGQSLWRVRVSDHHPDPRKIWVMASPAMIRERIGGYGDA